MNDRMRIEKSVSLAGKTTFHIGGLAEKFYIPESMEDMQQVVQEFKDEPFYVISGGSNLLINDDRVFGHVVSCERFSMDLIHEGDGLFYIGASNRIQKVISFVNAEGYGGFEELIGLPAMFGGIVYMNAGIGAETNPRFNICDFIVRVQCIEKIVTVFRN